MVTSDSSRPRGSPSSALGRAARLLRTRPTSRDVQTSAIRNPGDRGRPVEQALRIRMGPAWGNPESKTPRPSVEDEGARPQSSSGSRSRPLAYSPAAARSAGGSPCACCGRPPSVRSPSERRARPRLAGSAGRTARGGDGGPRDAPAIGRRQGTARARPGRPCRLPSDRRHTDAHARPDRCVASPDWRTTRSCGSGPRRRCSRLGGPQGEGQRRQGSSRWVSTRPS